MWVWILSCNEWQVIEGLWADQASVYLKYKSDELDLRKCLKQARCEKGREWKIMNLGREKISTA